MISNRVSNGFSYWPHTQTLSGRNHLCHLSLSMVFWTKIVLLFFTTLFTFLFKIILTILLFACFIPFQEIPDFNVSWSDMIVRVLIGLENFGTMCIVRIVVLRMNWILQTDKRIFFDQCATIYSFEINICSLLK